MTINITTTEQKIFDTVLAVATKHDITLRVAGGWVRDKLLGKDSHDIDIAVDGVINGEPVTGAVFAALVSKETGSSFAIVAANPEQSKHLETAIIRLHDVSVDLVHLRSESYGDSRIPEISVGTPEVDAHRRDLTINSLFFNINTSTVEDLTGKGIADLKAGIIRTPLPSKQTLLDDPLRALRAIRFAARFGFELEAELVDAMKDSDVQVAFNTKVKLPRMVNELDGILLANPVRGTRLLVETGILNGHVPELTAMDFDQQTRFHDKTVLEHTLALVEEIHDNHPHDVDLKWAALLHDIGKPFTATPHKDGVSLTFVGHEQKGADITENILTKLRFSNDRIKNIKRLVNKHMITFHPKWSDFKTKSWLRKHFASVEEFNRLIALRGADINALNPEHNAEPKKNHDALVAKTANFDVEEVLQMTAFVDGTELQRIFGRKPGKWIRVVQDKMVDLQLQGVVLNKEDAVARAEKWAEREAEKEAVA